MKVENGGSVVTISVPDESTAAEAGARLERVFGLAKSSVCLACPRDSEAIAAAGLPVFERTRPRSFSVRVRRRDKQFPLTSQDLEREIGALLQRSTSLPVDLSRPGLSREKVLAVIDTGSDLSIGNRALQTALARRNRLPNTVPVEVSSVTGQRFIVDYTQVGTLEANKWADFVALDADPLADISNVKKIDSVWIAGNRVKR